jgi:hypothetical protein
VQRLSAQLLQIECLAISVVTVSVKSSRPRIDTTLENKSMMNQDDLLGKNESNHKYLSVSEE